MHIRKAILTVVLVLLAVASVEAQVIPQKALRYANPLVMEGAGRLADPTVIKFQGKYYLYLTGGVSPGGLSGAVV